MIKDSVKKKFLEELAKTGIISAACARVHISRATYYRWIDSNPKFRELVEKSDRYGRDTLNDRMEMRLIAQADQGDQKALAYYLSHRHPGYKPQPKQDIVIKHVTENKEKEAKQYQKSWVELMHERRKKLEEEKRKKEDADKPPASSEASQKP